MWPSLAMFVVWPLLHFSPLGVWSINSLPQAGHKKFTERTASARQWTATITHIFVDGKSAERAEDLHNATSRARVTA